MEVGGREIQSPSKDSIEMILLLTCFNLKEKCDNLIFKEMCANSKHTHSICFDHGGDVWFCVAVNKCTTVLSGLFSHTDSISHAARFTPSLQ